MWIVIEGLAGSGKTWLQTYLMRKEWKRGAEIHANYNIKFSEENERVHRFFAIDELYHLTKSVIGFDEIQDVLGHWMSMPISFRAKIAHHRHHYLDVLCNTQDFNDIHVELRRNVHEVYRCQSLFRYPYKDSAKPLFQIIRVIFKTRQAGDDNDRIKFKKQGRARFYFLSRLWTKEYYETFANIEQQQFLCKLSYEKKISNKTGTWKIKTIDRDLINSGKRRV